jgi:hypothetical protein
MQWLAQQTTSEKIHHSRKKKAFLDFISGKPLEPESSFFFSFFSILIKIISHNECRERKDTKCVSFHTI